MGLELGLSAAALVASLERVGRNCDRELLGVARREAREIRELAVAFAPHDEGMLEKAIKVREAKGLRDDAGRFARNVLEVFVDPTMPGSGGQGALPLADYAYLMHEGLGPFGDGTYMRRDGSLQKDAGRGVVGGKFLERALNLRKTALARAAEQAVERVIRNA